MSEIQRYDYDHAYGAEMVRADSGEWILHAEHLTALEDKEREIQRLREALDAVEWILVHGNVQCPSCLSPIEKGHGVLCKTDEALRPTPEKDALRAKQNAVYAAAALASPAPKKQPCPKCKGEGIVGTSNGSSICACSEGWDNNDEG